jgi:lysosomal acid lipase/cholesteryl ester hydrolase
MCIFVKYDIEKHFQEERGKSLIKLINFLFFEENGHKPNSDYRFGYKEKANYYGFEFEEHKITTDDGYILTAWRLYKKENNDLISKKRAVIINHGLLDSAYTFLAFDDDKKCLPLILANRG